MNHTTGTLAVNQLLGRQVYFHVLFIEPSLPPRHPAHVSPQLCCRHARPDPSHVVSIDIGATPWSALTQIATDLGAESCRDDTSGCCPACRVRACATTVADCWIAAEHHAYAPDHPIPDHIRRQWSAGIADRMASVFACLHGLRCARRSGVDTTRTPPAERFPLTGELARLWLDPTRPAPVVSWLNHCAGLDDIAYRLRQGSTP